ncbi:MAG: ribosomal-processing cysteine protease Prp [Eubacterium sp.]|nr:ribosomal-processing cysteine protease Prp [Eubacterium sp.]MCR5292328.1 ribosomal-processing cysteine protease Prp [Eubacterium sp.]
MVNAVFYLKDKKYFGFSVSGHAGYNDEGNDIVCSAVSALTINTVNSIEQLCRDEYKKSIDERGSIRFKVMNPASKEAELLIRSLRIGLCNIYEQYGNDYIRVFIREV